MSCVLLGPIHFFYLRRIGVSEVGEYLSLWPINSSVGVFLSFFHVFLFCFPLMIFIVLLFHYLSSSSLYPPHSIFQVCLRNYLRMSARDCGLKIVTNVELSEKQECSPKFVHAARISGASEIEHNEFKRSLYSTDRDCGSSSNLIFITAVKIQKDSFPILYVYELHRASMDEIPESLGIY